MAFKKRKADYRKLDAPSFSGAAEVCETRAMLSADGLCLPAVDADAVVIEDIEVTDSEEAVEFNGIVEDGEFIPELAVCTMLVPEFLDGVEVYEEGIVSEDGEALIPEEDVDPSLMFYSFMSCEGGDPAYVEGAEVAICDIVDDEPVFKGQVDEIGIDGEEDFEVSLEDFEPSWIYRSFAATGEEVVEDVEFTCEVIGEEVIPDDLIEEEFVDVTTLEDYDPSWAYLSFITSVPEDGTEVIEEIVDGEEEPEECVEEEYFDITTMEDFDPSWAYRGTVVDGEKDPEADVLVDENEVVIEDGEATEEEVVYLQDGAFEDGSEVPVRYYFGMNFRGNTGGELPVEAVATTTGEPQEFSGRSTSPVMGPVVSSAPVATTAVNNVPVVLNQPVAGQVVVNQTLAIPVNNGGFTPLFVEEEEVLVTTLAPVVSEIETLVSEVDDSLSPTLDSGFGDLIGSSPDNSRDSIGELTPIFEDEKDEKERVEVPVADDVPVEIEESVGSVDAPQQPVEVASRPNYRRSIDEFMSEFAMSGFTG